MRKKRTLKRNISAPTPRTLDVRHRPPPVELVKRDVLKPEPIRRQPDMRPVEDLRHETEQQTFRTRSGRPARTEVRPQGDVSKSRLHTPVHAYFQDPQRVLVCIRRENRKRVLFALQRIGRGRRVRREHRYTEKSYLRCK